MSTDNRTMLNDCEANTGWTGDDASSVVTATGEFYEGSAGLSSQFSDTVDEMYTTQDSVGAGTFNIDLSDSTVYMIVKDNLGEPFSAGGMGIILGDGTDRIGYHVGGNDAVGIPLATFFSSYKLDVSVIVAAPGTDFTVQAGSEANLAQTAITQIGIQTHHLAKANGPSDNCFYDAFRYIANDSYALTINGGTSGTPETMADVVGDDATNGWGLTSNPVADQYYFFGPTEWGEDAAAANHYFTASNEQWYWLGDNGGGHSVGATHMPMRVIGNATDTGSFVITNVVIVNTGTGAEFDCSSADVNTLEIDGCTMIGLASFSAPSSGGTSRFCTNTIFSQCGQVTHNGASMNNCSVLDSTVAADEGALFYDEAADPDGEMDGMTFTKGTNSHHAIRFGTNVPATMTLRNCTFNGFGSTEDATDAIFRFDDTTGSITLNLVGCSNDGGAFSKDDAAGVDVTISIDPVTTEITVNDNNGAALQNAYVYAQAKDGTGPLPFEESVTITRSGTVATVSHTAHGMNTNEYIKLKGITGNKDADNNGAHQLTVVDANSYTFVTANSGDTTYSGTITATGVTLYGQTDVSGQISSSRTYSGDQPLSGNVRLSTTSPRFKSFTIDATVDATNGLALPIRMVLDE